MTNNRTICWGATGIMAMGMTTTVLAEDQPQGILDRVAVNLPLNANGTQEMPGRQAGTPGGPYNLFTNPAPRDFRRPLAPVRTRTPRSRAGCRSRSIR